MKKTIETFREAQIALAGTFFLLLGYSCLSASLPVAKPRRRQLFTAFLRDTFTERQLMVVAIVLGCSGIACITIYTMRRPKKSKTDEGISWDTPDYYKEFLQDKNRNTKK